MRAAVKTSYTYLHTHLTFAVADSTRQSVLLREVLDVHSAPVLSKTVPNLANSGVFEISKTLIFPSLN